jgi:hypothetical protein
VLVVSVDAALRHGGARVAAAVQAARVVDGVPPTVVVAVVSDVVARMLVVALVVAMLPVLRRVAHFVVWGGVAGQQDMADVEHLERGQAPELILEAVPEFPPGLGRRCHEQRRARDHGQGDERPTSGPATCRVHGVSPYL